jgi:hypothetical protein
MTSSLTDGLVVVAGTLGNCSHWTLLPHISVKNVVYERNVAEREELHHLIFHAAISLAQ